MEAQILVITDSPDERQITAAALRPICAQPQFAAASGEQLEAASRALPRLIVLDLCGPAARVAEVFGAVRRLPRLAGVPVLLVLPPEDHDAFRAVIEKGAVYALPRPYQSGDLLRAARHILAGHAAPGGSPANEAGGAALPAAPKPEALLHALAEASGFLLTETDFAAAAGGALAALGAAADACRAVLVENRIEPDSGELVMHPLMQWNHPRVAPEVAAQPLDGAPYYPHYMRLYAVLTAGRPYTGKFDQTAPEAPGLFARCGAQSFLAVPIAVESKLWGFLALEDGRAGRVWTPGELSIMQAAAAGFGGDIRRRRIEQVESEQRRLAEALRDSAKVINQSLNLNVVLEQILDNIDRVVPHDAANIMLVEGEYARLTHGRGYENMGVENLVFNQLRKIADIPNLKRMLDTGETIVIPDTRSSGAWVNFKTSGWIRSYASAPICHKGATIGFLNLNSRIPGFYSEKEAARLRAFADQAAVAIANARLFEKAQQELAERTRAEEALQSAMNALEERVEQRTAELRAMNDQLHRELGRRQKAEQALEEERALLAQRIEERTAELSVANAELAKAARMKDAFLASMSHELRTPLNAILNVAETLQEEVYGALSPAQRRSVTVIENSGRHLLSLINDILDLSKIGAGKFELVPDSVPVKALCESSMQFVEEAARMKNIRLALALDPAVTTVWADQRRLKQILVNLLNNAVKFTQDGGTVELSVVGSAEEGRVYFAVTDTGIGISEEGISRLFKPFVQLDNSLSRQFEGTGLGLALVYNLVEMHGGGVRVESEIGQGSRFTVTLPWDPALALGGDRAGEAGGEPDLYTSPVIRVSRLLNEAGINTHTGWIENGRLRGALTPPAGLLVMDFRLYPQYCLAAERMGLDGQTPVLLVAERRPGADRPTLPFHVGYLEFPFNAQELRKTIREIVPGGTAGLAQQVMLVFERSTARLENRPLILLVDDNETAIRTVADYLLSKEFRVGFAYNGADAVERARETQPDLILMDIQMPGMDGFEAIRRIRADARTRAVPVIAVTALAMPGDQARCMEVGANDYLSKPVSLKGLVQRIQALLPPAAG